MIKRKFLVTGAAGRTGSATVRLLLEAGHSVRAMVHRDDDRAQNLRLMGAEVWVGDLLRHDDVIRSAEGIEGAYFCWPVAPDIIRGTAYFADAARRAGMKIIVNMSQISARDNAESYAARDHWVAERIFDWSQVPTCHLRPTFFAEWLVFPWTSTLIRELGIIDLPYGDGRHAPIAAHDQARLIAAILIDPASHVGNIYGLHGPVEMSQADIAAVISKEIGREVTYRPATIGQYHERLQKFGLPAFLLQHFDHVAVDYQNGVFAGEDDIISRVTGKSPMTVEEFVGMNRSFFVPE